MRMPEVDDYHKGDFVRAYPSGSPQAIEGQILDVKERDGEEKYHVEQYSKHGPTGKVIRCTEDELELHPDGRMSVMDNINDHGQNDNQGE